MTGRPLPERVAALEAQRAEDRDRAKRMEDMLGELVEDLHQRRGIIAGKREAGQEVKLEKTERRIARHERNEWVRAFMPSAFFSAVWLGLWQAVTQAVERFTQAPPGP